MYIFNYDTNSKLCISQEPTEKSIENCKVHLLFPTLFDYIDLNPGFIIIRAVDDSINGD